MQDFPALTGIILSRFCSYYRNDNIYCGCEQVPLQNIGFIWLEFSPRPFSRGGETDSVQSIRHQVCDHRPGEGRQGERGNNEEIDIMPENCGEITRKLKLFRLATQRASQSVTRFSYLGSSGKFDLKNTVINIVAGLGLLSFITMFCDFVLLHYVKERKIVSHAVQLNQKRITAK